MLAKMVVVCAGIVGWLLTETVTHGRPIALGAPTGGIGGAGRHYRECAFVGPLGAVVIGLLTGCICFFAVAKLKLTLGYDDSLDVFELHGGGVVKAPLTGPFATPALGCVCGRRDALGIGAGAVEERGVYLRLLFRGELGDPGRDQAGDRLGCFPGGWLDLAEYNERAYNLQTRMNPTVPRVAYTSAKLVMQLLPSSATVSTWGSLECKPCSV